MTELGDLVMQRALKPYQAAVFIVESFPSRPDGFALVTAVAQNLSALPIAAHHPRSAGSRCSKRARQCRSRSMLTCGLHLREQWSCAGSQKSEVHGARACA